MTYLNVLRLALVIALPIAACNKSAGSAADLDVEIANTGPEITAGPEVDSADVADLAGDAAQPDGDDLIETLLDTAEISGQSDVKADVEPPGEVTPTGICDDGLQLPHAGSACTEEGAVHCSRIGEGVKLLYYGAAGPYTICRRPHQVTCAKSSAGGLSWQLSDCPAVTAECAVYGPNSQTCQENSRGAHCCPAGVALTANYTSEYTLCRAGDVGAKWCQPVAPNSSGGGIYTCDFPDKVLKNPGLEATKNKQFATACANSCKDCLFFLGDECPKFYWASCNGCTKSECPESGQYCLPNLPGKPNPSCVENCEDFKMTKDYKPH